MASTTAVSVVEVSVSTETQLNVRSIDPAEHRVELVGADRRRR